MLDGAYQSVICFFMAYVVFSPTSFVTTTGQSINDRERFGIYVACAAIIVVNTYVLLNSYRWDWLITLLVAISILLIFFWTGVYSAFTGSERFYKAAPQVFGQPSFWALTILTVVVCLLPRFFVKSMQKMYFPYDVDIIREQVRQGKFKYLDDVKDSDMPKSGGSATAPSAIVQPSKHSLNLDEERRPIYPPSVAPTATTHNPRSHNGSDGTDYTRHRVSMEPPLEALRRRSTDRPRPSFDRMRASMDRTRMSYEASNDFTSAAMLTRFESTHSIGPVQSRRQDMYGIAR
jgi:phospholipid-translocating ATPase